MMGVHILLRLSLPNNVSPERPVGSVKVQQHALIGDKAVPI